MTQSIPGAGENISVPWVNSPQWIPGEQVSDIKLNRRFDQPMDALRPLIKAGVGSQMARYFGRVTPGTYNTPGAQVALTSIIDTAGIAGGPVGTSEAILAPPPGVYIVSCSLRNTPTSPLNFDWALTNSGLAGAPTNAVGYNGESIGVTMRLTSQIWVSITAGSFTPEPYTAPGLGNWLSLFQIGW